MRIKVHNPDGVLLLMVGCAVLHKVTRKAHRLWNIGLET